MFRNVFQSGYLSILYSIGTKPLQLWHAHLPSFESTSNYSTSTDDAPAITISHIEFVEDDIISSPVIELLSPNLTETYIICPAQPDYTLGIKLPVLILLIKNLNRYFSMEVEILDDKGLRRRFRASNFQITTRIQPDLTTMPMRFEEGWNQVALNLSEYTRKIYGSSYVETLRVTIHANCRIRRIFFAERVLPEEEFPSEFRLFLKDKDDNVL